MMDSEDRLLGYLLGDCDACERAELGRLIKNSPDVARKLSAVRRKYAVLLDGFDAVVPPEGLAARTCGGLFFGDVRSQTAADGAIDLETTRVYKNVVAKDVVAKSAGQAKRVSHA